MKSCSKFTAGPSLQRMCAITLHAAEVVLAPVCWADLTVDSEDRGCNLVIEEFPAASVPSDTRLSKRLLKLTGIPCFLSLTKGIKFKFKSTNASTFKYQMPSHFLLSLPGESKGLVYFKVNLRDWLCLGIISHQL